MARQWPYFLLIRVKLLSLDVENLIDPVTSGGEDGGLLVYEVENNQYYDDDE